MNDKTLKMNLAKNVSRAKKHTTRGGKRTKIDWKKHRLHGPKRGTRDETGDGASFRATGVSRATYSDIISRGRKGTREREQKERKHQDEFWYQKDPGGGSEKNLNAG